MAKNNEPTPFTECPNCQVQWGAEEIDFQQCDSCGYPLRSTEENDDEFEPENY